MTDQERLVELMERLTFEGLFCDIAMCTKEIACPSDCSCSQRQVWERLKQYEDAEEAGRLLVLPCNISTPIFLICLEKKQKRKPHTYRVDEFHIDHFTIGGAMIPMITACSDDNEWVELIDGTQKGQEYFLTREAAEAALKGGETE